MASSVLFDISHQLRDQIPLMVKRLADALSNVDTSALIVATAVGLATVGVSVVTYNIFLHHLRHFPGPLLFRATRLSISFAGLTGHLPERMSRWHEVYGPVVRVAPDELVFASSAAWRDIYGVRRDLPPDRELAKDYRRYRLYRSAPQSVLTADHALHARLRRGLAPSFSDKAMRDQEPMIRVYVDMLINGLKEAAAAGTGGKPKPQNMRDWYNFTTFDIIGDLTFGESFHCLDTKENRGWMRLFSERLRSSYFTQVLRANGMPYLGLAYMWFQSRSKDIRSFVQGKMAFEDRIKGEPRPDLMDSLIRQMEQEKLTAKNLLPTAILLTIAGSETTATLLAGVTFLLLDNPDCLAKVTDEVRSAFKTDDEITLLSVGQLSYMLECLTEALRLYPPVPTGMPRVTPPCGATIDGVFVPGNTVVSIYQYVIGRSEKHWTNPLEYHPERISRSGKFVSDNLDALNPFGIGPRNCVGMNLAYAEMRLILARILFNFDMELAEESRNWLDGQRIFTLWDKPPLMVHLHPRQQ